MKVVAKVVPDSHRESIAIQCAVYPGKSVDVKCQTSGEVRSKFSRGLSLTYRPIVCVDLQHEGVNSGRGERKRSGDGRVQAERISVWYVETVNCCQLKRPGWYGYRLRFELHGSNS